LRSQLAQEIARRIHEVALREFEAILHELNTFGHETELSTNYDPEFAGWAYAAEHSKQDDDAQRLRFYYDSQVSCRYD
jgi:hypothetical protein